MTTQLSPHFTLEEMTATDHHTIDNTAPPEIVEALTRSAAAMEYVREALGVRPIHVNSGYRCPELNTAVGGSPTSSHMDGEAVDFICPDFGAPLDICRQLAAPGVLDELPFDQLIQEGTWVHIGFGPQMRDQVLTKNPNGDGYLEGLPPT
jgi:hypothetical protein